MRRRFGWRASRSRATPCPSGCSRAQMTRCAASRAHWAGCMRAWRRSMTRSRAARRNGERMRLLTYLSLAYAAVLVLALAVVLITILVFLRRIGRALARVQRSLEEAAVRTAPLASRLGPGREGPPAAGARPRP